MSHPSLIDLFTRTLDPKPFRLLARQTRWSQRKGKIDPFEFITSLTFGQMSASRATLTSQAQSLSEPVSRQGIDQRFNPASVDFFKASFAHIMAETLSGSPSHPQAELLRAHFKAVYLLDSTCYDCPETLQSIFPSCGGDGSAANAKVLLRYEVIAGCLEPLQVLEGKRSDQGLALATTQLLREGQLQIQDKGFYDGKAWQAAFQTGAYLLMPLPHSLTLSQLIPGSSDKEELDLAQILKHTSENRIEWSELWLGKEKRCIGPVRLVAFRLTPENASRKRQALRESMRTQGRTPSEKALQLAGWLLLITNAPPQKLPSSVISYLYRLRWQVELIFRQTKTVLRLDKTESEDPYRIQCEIWARLISAVLLFLWHAHANAQSWLLHGCEVSFEKLIRIMQHWGLTLSRALSAQPSELLQVLRDIWKRLLLHARKGRQKSRPTTWENLFDLWLNTTSIPAQRQPAITMG